jgi:hypothetical protein
VLQLQVCAPIPSKKLILKSFHHPKRKSHFTLNSKSTTNLIYIFMCVLDISYKLNNIWSFVTGSFHLAL